MAAIAGHDGARRSRHLSGSAGRVTLLVGTFAIVCAAGCAGPKRAVMEEAELRERSSADLAESGAALSLAVDRIFHRMEREVGARGGEEPVLHILAMSGGGDYGAFGAGFLVGWGQAADTASRRPDFDVVTGVSTGALLAPFAYLGTDEACLEVENFYRNPKKDWLRTRGMFFFLPSNPSFMSIPGLERDVRNAIDRDIVDRMAAESRKGKVLAISATDLDFGRQKIWNLGTEAEAATDDTGVDRVQRILLSSAAIPAVFPPMEIGEGVYADGGVTANVLLKLETKNPAALLPRWMAEHPETPLPKVRYWIIINNQLHQPPKSVQIRWPAIVAPALATSIRSATLAEVRWLAAEADYVNAVYGTDIEVHVAAVPDDWHPPVEGDFKAETMNSLADVGRKMGADPGSWTLWTTPRVEAGTAALGH